MSIFSLPFALLSRKTGATILVMLGSLVYGISLSISGFILDTQLLVWILLLCGMGAGVMFVPSMIMAASMAKREYNATVMAGFTGVGSIGFMLGPICSVFLLNYLQKVYKEQSFGILSAGFGFLEVLIVIFTVPIYKRLREAV